MFNVLVGQIQIARVLDSECFRALFTSYYLKTKWNKDETLEKDSFQFPDDQYFNKSLINWYQKRVWRYDRAIFIYFSWSYAKQLFLFLFFRAPSCQKWQWGNLLQHSTARSQRHGHSSLSISISWVKFIAFSASRKITSTLVRIYCET